MTPPDHIELVISSAIFADALHPDRPQARAWLHLARAAQGFQVLAAIHVFSPWFAVLRKGRPPVRAEVLRDYGAVECWPHVDRDWTVLAPEHLASFAGQIDVLKGRCVRIIVLAHGEDHAVSEHDTVIHCAPEGFTSATAHLIWSVVHTLMEGCDANG